jgi:four helix bundle protein
MPEYHYQGNNSRTFQHLHGFKKLVAWQAASDLRYYVNRLANRFGLGQYALADQMRRAASSVSANIAEGYCVGSLPNYIRHCNLARGSLGELGSFLQDCERDGLVKGDELASLIEQYRTASIFLDRLIQSLIKKREDGTWDNRYWVEEQSVAYSIESTGMEPFDTDDSSRIP